MFFLYCCLNSPKHQSGENLVARLVERIPLFPYANSPHKITDQKMILILAAAIICLKMY